MVNEEWFRKRMYDQLLRRLNFGFALNDELQDVMHYIEKHNISHDKEEINKLIDVWIDGYITRVTTGVDPLDFGLRKEENKPKEDEEIKTD